MRFLFVDRILHSSPGEVVRGIKHVTKDDFYLTKDNEGRHCFIPSLIGETLGQLAAWNVMQVNGFSLRPVAGVVASACLHRPAYVGETLLLESWIDSLDDQAVQYHSLAKVGDEPVFSIDGALGPLLPMSDFIDPNVVRQQFEEIYRPGDWPVPAVAGALALDDNAEIHPPMTFDRFLESEAGLQLVGEKRITRASPYFPDHFPQKPVLPMTVLLECILHMAREFVLRAGYQADYQVSELRNIKMNEFVQPGDVLRCLAKVKEQTEEALTIAFRCELDGKRVCVVNVVLRSANRP